MSKTNKAAATVITKEKMGISGSTLKLIAIITMLIDHIGWTIYQGMVGEEGLSFFGLEGMSILNIIGRISFPIFCFLLVEGFHYTKDKWNYARRLAIFALISEIPFDLAFYGKVMDMRGQNVFFELLIGIFVIIGFQSISEKLKDKKWLPALGIVGVFAAGYLLTQIIDTITHTFIYTFYIFRGYPARTVFDTVLENMVFIAIISYSIMLIVFVIMWKKKSFQVVTIRFAYIAVLAAGMILSVKICSDYDMFGILTIAVMYGLRKNKLKSMLCGILVLTVPRIIMGSSAIFALLPVAFYNGKRGMNLKYIFYAFYPVHLIILYAICYYMKLL